MPYSQKKSEVMGTRSHGAWVIILRNVLWEEASHAQPSAVLQPGLAGKCDTESNLELHSKSTEREPRTVSELLIGTTWAVSPSTGFCVKTGVVSGKTRFNFTKNADTVIHAVPDFYSSTAAWRRLAGAPPDRHFKFTLRIVN
jgi:hypothetical protein